MPLGGPPRATPLASSPPPAAPAQGRRPSRAPESAASELVDESLHPVEQLERLDEQARLLRDEGDFDAVAECRMKQVALHTVLVHLYGFPLAHAIRAKLALAEAYAGGKYFAQAREHIGAAELSASSDIEDALQSKRLKVDCLIAEGVVHLEEGAEHFDDAKQCLARANRMTQEVYGDGDERLARIHGMLGRIALQQEDFPRAKDHFEDAMLIHSEFPEGEEHVRLQLQVAEAVYLGGDVDEAIRQQDDIVSNIHNAEALPVVLADASMRLATWLSKEDRADEALKALETAEKAVVENLGQEDAKAVDIKREIAIQHLKLGDNNKALQCLQDVEFLARRLHGSQSRSVARTLKALGYVHCKVQNYSKAEQCYLQALRIFEIDQTGSRAIIRDIQASLGALADLRRSAP